MGSEDEQTIKQRVARTSDPRLIFMEREQFISSRNHLKECCEEYSLRIDNGEIDWINDYEREIQEIEEKIAIPLELLNEKLGWNTEKSWFIDSDEVKRLKNRADTLRSRQQSLRETIEFRKSGQVLTDDNGAIGMSFICKLGKSEGQLIYLWQRCRRDFQRLRFQWCETLPTQYHRGIISGRLGESFPLEELLRQYTEGIPDEGRVCQWFLWC